MKPTRAIGHLAVFVLCLLSACGVRGAVESDTIYLFSTFKYPEEDGLRYAYSLDGYHWSAISGLFLRAGVGGGIMRDPSVCRGPDGTWHVVWTTAWRGDRGFGYARSKDLEDWSEQRFIPVMAHEPTAVNVWAPELFYDDGAKKFMVCWASTIPGRYPDDLEPHDNNHRLYFTTTSDFTSFAPTKLFLDPGFSVIDGQILKVASRYVLLLKDNTRPRRNIRVAFGDSPVGPWGDISTNLTAKFTEGPCALKVGPEWLVYYDSYQAGRYGALKTRDFKNFADVTGEMAFPNGLKHGTAFKATRNDLDRITKTGAGQRDRRGSALE